MPAFAASASGYVVKIESNTVYIDLGEATGASAGQGFVVYTEGADLKHPVTGEILGREENFVARGQIDQVFPKYSVGHIAPGAPVAQAATPVPITSGQRAKLEQKTAPPQQTSAPQHTEGRETTSLSAAAATGAPVRTPTWRSPAMNMEAVDLALGDVDGDGSPEIIIADQTHIQAYPYNGTDWKSICDFEDKSTGARILSIEAADLNKDGKTELFVTENNTFFNRVETLVLQCQDHVFKKLEVLPWMTRAFQSDSGEFHLAVQELMADANFPFGGIYPLEYKDGKYARSSPPIRQTRLDWLYSFGMARGAEGGEPFYLFYTSSNRIRVQFKKAAWLSTDTYGQTSNRIRWLDRPLMFYPRLILSQSPGGLTGAYTLRNIAGFGGLSGAFGIYNNSELHHLKWNGLSLEPDWKADLGGYAADVALRPEDTSHPAEILVAVVSSGGKTSVWKFQP